MEIWDVYDEDRRPTGKTAVRGRAEPGLHLIVHVCLFSPGGRLLAQKRHRDKSMWPGLWDLSAGGAALAGENSRQAAERETWEELGYALDLRGVRPALTVNFSRGFDDLYALVCDVELSRLRMQPSEVEALAWLERDQVHQKIDRGEFVPYRRALIDLLFDMRGSMGNLAPR